MSRKAQISSRPILRGQRTMKRNTQITVLIGVFLVTAVAVAQELPTAKPDFKDPLTRLLNAA
jgi:hypothetical protein